MHRGGSELWKIGLTREWWLGLTPVQRFQILETWTDRQVETFFKDWRVWARAKQLLPEGAWKTAYALCGRGFGKTRLGAEWIRHKAETMPAGARFCLLGQGTDDVRDVMIEGDSGLLAVSPSWNRPKWQPSVGGGRLYWPNGSTGFVFSSEDPEALRGPQFHAAWVDEPMAMKPENRKKAISNMKFGLRLGVNPQLLYTTTPKPHRWISEELEKAEKSIFDPVLNPLGKNIIIRGTTYENDALPDSFREMILDDYEGTSLGRQEIYAELLGDEMGALWTPAILDATRIRPDHGVDHFEFAKAFSLTCSKLVVGVDPNVTSTAAAHEAGIVVAGAKGSNRYALDDYSCKGGPHKWAAAAIQAYLDYDADEIVAEINQGGDLVKKCIEDEARDQGIADIRVIKVRATRGKQRRAEPVSASYERKLIGHVGEVGHDKAPGKFYKLEKQLCSLHDGYDPTGEDFDRADALVWAMTRLGKKGSASSNGPGAGIFTFQQLLGEAA